MQLDEHLLGAFSTAVRVPVLALVPLFTGLSRWSDVVATATRAGQRVSVNFGFPYPPADLWTFASPPDSGVRGEVVDVPMVVEYGLLANVIATALVVLVVRGLLVAGLLGSVDQFLVEERYEFGRNVRRYGLRILGYQAVVLGTMLVLAGIGLVSPVLLLVVIPFVVVLGYVFYLTPYLIVVEDRATIDAFRRSARLTTDRIPAALFFLYYVALVAVASVPLSLVLNVGMTGVLLAATAASLLGLVLTAFAVRFTRDLVGLEPARGIDGTEAAGPSTP